MSFHIVSTPRPTRQKLSVKYICKLITDQFSYTACQCMRPGGGGAATQNFGTHVPADPEKWGRSECGRLTENGGGESEDSKTGGGQLGKNWGSYYKSGIFFCHFSGNSLTKFLNVLFIWGKQDIFLYIIQCNYWGYLILRVEFLPG